MAKVKTPRWGWALTGSGHFFKECLRMIGELDEVDRFVSKAAGGLKAFHRTRVVETLEQLEAALIRRKRDLHG
jgi:dihydromethanopterin reductase (acceptor)